MNRFSSYRYATILCLVTFALTLYASENSWSQYPEYHYFQFNEGQGTTTSDLASPGLGSQANFNATWAPSGRLGFSALENNWPQQVLGAMTTNAQGTITGSWTVEFWLYDGANGAFNRPFGFFVSNTFYCTCNGAAGIGNVNLLGQFNPVIAVGAAPANAWSHVAFVYDDNAHTITPYTNGVGGSPVPQPNNVAINFSNPTGLIIGDGFNGQIDEFRLWGQARTAIQIQNNMAGEISSTPSSTNLAIVKLNTPQSALPCQALGATEWVNFRVGNVGGQSIPLGSSFAADLVVNGLLVRTETFYFLNGSLQPFGYENFVFPAPLDLSAGGVYTTEITIRLPGDVDASNDKIIRSIVGSANNDLSCEEITTPVDSASCSTSQSAEVVSFVVKNVGSSDLAAGSSFSADLLLDGVLHATENFQIASSKMTCQSSRTFAFVNRLDLSAGGIRNVGVVLHHVGDTVAANDAQIKAVDAGIGTDLDFRSILSPKSALGCASRSATEKVTFRVENRGSMTIAAGQSFSAFVKLDGALMASENFILPSPLPCGFVQQFDFLTTLDLSTPGSLMMNIGISFPGDLVPTNDQATVLLTTQGPSVGTMISSFPYLEDFDSFGANGNGATAPLHHGWAQSTDETIAAEPDWYFGTATPSSNAGPETLGLGDHTSGSGRFGYIEDSADSSSAINLLSPCFELIGISSARGRIWVNTHNYGSGPGNSNSITVDLFTDAGFIATVAAAGYDTGDKWIPLEFSLDPYVGQTIQVQIRSTNKQNQGANCDSAIDDFAIFEPTLSLGQAPRAGIATLDLNHSINQNVRYVASGEPGPYITSVLSGETLDIEMECEPFSGIVLISGPQNIGVANFPGFGQFDIGTLPLNSAGIPGTLIVWADGVTAPVGGVNQLFIADMTGNASYQTSLPSLPLGPLASFQTVNSHSALLAAFSNAVELVIE